jgi:hypothetical protein
MNTPIQSIGEKLRTIRFAKYGFVKLKPWTANKKNITKIAHKKYGNKIVLLFFFRFSKKLGSFT